MSRSEDNSKFTDINDAYSNFIGKVSSTIDKIAPMKEIPIKNSSKDWVDEEILEEIKKHDKLFAKFKSVNSTVRTRTVK